ncbi:MAG TPA: NAD(P)-binding domain-containing protein [Xanthobacteraceae bacterium]|nr:NAD(P)-binding domain-containing protein [Xanthobacteraceae bacterium]
MTIVNTIFRDDCEVAIVGAGPYGLSLGAHFKSAGIETRIFGRPMSFWREHMPKGMKLRSPWAATHIVDPDNLLTLDAFSAAENLGRPDPLPLEDFVRYGAWFQKTALPDLDARKVMHVQPAANEFWLTLEDGATVRARRVVVAMGLANQEFRPAVFDGLPAELVSHAADHADLGKFAKQRVAVIGRGQSATESAAILNEAGAQVEIICRGSVHWLGAETSGHAHRRDIYWRMHKVLATKSGVGPFPLNWVNEQPDLIHRIPRKARLWLNKRSLRAGAAGWVRDRLPGVAIDAGRTIRSASLHDGRIMLELDNGSCVFDHVLLATGYRIDVARFGILAPALLAAITTDEGSPVLGPGYESSVPGLHFVGSSAVRSYGPLLRFVWGAGYAARSMTKFLYANRHKGVYAWPSPAGEAPARQPETASNVS